MRFSITGDSIEELEAKLDILKKNQNPALDQLMDDLDEWWFLHKASENVYINPRHIHLAFNRVMNSFKEYYKEKGEVKR